MAKKTKPLLIYDVEITMKVNVEKKEVHSEIFIPEGAITEHVVKSLLLTAYKLQTETEEGKPKTKKQQKKKPITKK
jgi:hypothetical protein